MDIKQVKALLRMFEGSSIHELEVESGEDRVRLVRSPSPALGVAQAAPLPPAPAPPAEPVPPGGGNGAVKPPAVEGHLLKAPVVGTFYRAPSPGAPQFVEIGAAVQAGQVLCIIEAMKLMNEIEAEQAGRVAEVFVENGQPVEFDHPLFRIVPA